MEKTSSNRPKLSDLHPNAIRGINLFNNRAYFEAHEELEIAWRVEKRFVKELYRAILQVGVAYYHIQKGNFTGAKKMFERSFKWLALYPQEYYGINLEQFSKDAQIAYQKLLTLGPDKIQHYPVILFKEIPRVD